MSKPLFDAVLFDFDGTVVDSSEGIYNSVLYALEAFGYPRPDEQALRYFIGPPLQHSFMHLLDVDEARAQALVEKYRERYRSQGVREVRLYDGVRPLLVQLKGSGLAWPPPSLCPLFGKFFPCWRSAPVSTMYPALILPRMTRIKRR